MSRVDAVIFDMDGTITNSIPFHMQSWDIFFEKHNVSLTPEQFHAIHYGTVYDIMPRIFGIHITEQMARQLGDDKESLFRELALDKMEPTLGLSQLLADLKRSGIKIGLATAADDANALFTLNALEITDVFDAVVTSSQVKEGKPSPAVYLEAAYRLNVQPANCVVFEDTSHGVEAAVAAGMRVYGIMSSLSKNDLLQAGAKDAFDDFSNMSSAKLNAIAHL